MAEIFGATLSLKDNVSGVYKQAIGNSKSFRAETEKAKQKLRELDKQKVAEKELRIKNSAAYKAIDGVKKRLEPLTKKTVEVVAKTEYASEKIKKVTSALSNIKDKTVNIAVNGAKAAGVALGKAALIGTAAAFTATAATAVLATTSAINFEAQMQNVGTLLDGDVKAKLQGMGTDLKRVSIDTGVATADLTDGLYQVVSAFGESAESVTQLEIAAKAAKAGNATTTDSVNLLSAVTKGYGDTSAEAMQKASDLAFATVKLGQTSFPELAASMGQVLPLAATLKVSQEELFGAMSTLTGVTGGTSEVTTQLKNTMQAFMSPSSEMAKALNTMGYETGAAALESEGLDGILKKLKDSVNGDEIAFANLFGSVEAKSAVLALTSAQADNFATKTAAMADASGIAQQAFETQTSSVKAMGDKIKNAGSVMLTSLGERVLPYITKALDKVIEHLPQMEEAFASVADKVGPIIDTILVKGSELWQSWQPVLSQMGTQFSTAIEQATPFFTGMMQNFERILPCVMPIISTFTGIIASILPVVAPIFSGISGVVAMVFPVITGIIQDVGDKIQGVFGSVGERAGILQGIFETVAPVIAGTLQAAWSVISPLLDLALIGIDAFMGAIDFAFPYIQGVIEFAWGIIQPIIEGIATGIGKMANAAKGVVGFFTGGSGDEKGSSGGGSRRSGFGHNATGTSYWSGGYTMVGEHGAELVNLPQGAKVHSSTQTSGMVSANGGSNININIASMSVRDESDIERVANEIVKKIDEARDNM